MKGLRNFLLVACAKAGTEVFHQLHRLPHEEIVGSKKKLPSARPRPTSRLLGNDRPSSVDPLVTGIGTHFAYLWVGTPPQRQTVIIDTGSYRTAFPCDPGCTPANCGNYEDYHEGPPFDPEQSSTCAQTEQRWNQQYGEGDGWSASVIEDVAWTGGEFVDDIGPDKRLVLENFEMGCQDQIDGLFVTQRADGIMGMAASDATPVAQLVAAGVLEEERFSLCLASDGGTMALGGAALHLHAAPMQYVDMYVNRGVFFGVHLVDILIYSESTSEPASDIASIGVPSGSYGSAGDFIVDSGTTYSYLPVAMQSSFEERWKEVTGFAYDTNRALTEQQASGPLPVLEFVLRDKAGSGLVRVPVRATAYVDHYCYGSAAAPTCSDYLSVMFEGSTRLLGANFMQDRDVLFDRGSGRLGFAAVDSCAYGEWPTPSPSTTPAPSVSSAPTPAPSAAPPRAWAAFENWGLVAALAAAVLWAGAVGCAALRSCLRRARARRAEREAARQAGVLGGAPSCGERLVATLDGCLGPCLGPCGGGAAGAARHSFAALEDEEVGGGSGRRRWGSGGDSGDQGGLEMKPGGGAAAVGSPSPDEEDVVEVFGATLPSSEEDTATSGVLRGGGALGQRELAEAVNPSSSSSAPATAVLSPLERLKGYRAKAKGYTRPGEGDEF